MTASRRTDQPVQRCCAPRRPRASAPRSTDTSENALSRTPIERWPRAVPAVKRQSNADSRDPLDRDADPIRSGPSILTAAARKQQSGRGFSGACFHEARAVSPRPRAGIEAAALDAEQPSRRAPRTPTAWPLAKRGHANRRSGRGSSVSIAAAGRERACGSIDDRHDRSAGVIPFVAKDSPGSRWPSQAKALVASAAVGQQKGSSATTTGRARMRPRDSSKARCWMTPLGAMPVAWRLRR